MNQQTRLVMLLGCTMLAGYFIGALTMTIGFKAVISSAIVMTTVFSVVWVLFYQKSEQFDEE